MTNNIQDLKSFTVRSDTEKLAPAIIEVMHILRKHGIESWLCYGALLGVIRENRLLPWNNDAELGCWYEDRINGKFCTVVNELNKKGYHANYYSLNGSLAARRKGVIVNINCFWRENGYAVRPHELPVVFKRAPYIAVVLYWIAAFMSAYPAGFLGNTIMPLSKNELIRIILVSFFKLLPSNIRKKISVHALRWSIKCGGTYQKTGIPEIFFQKFIEWDFYGSQVMVPVEPERLLQCIYGESWRVPKESWSFYDEGNRGETGIVFIDEVWNYDNMDIV